MEAKLKKKIVVYIHGKGGSNEEAKHYVRLFPEYDVIGFNYTAQTPWEAKNEFNCFFNSLICKTESIILIANSIGAYFAMSADIDAHVQKAYFISPIVSMENLICCMMKNNGVTENELKEKGTIYTNSGDELSWKYLSYVKNHPPKWNTSTEILYASKDNFTSYETIRQFAEKHNANLTVMDGGEHWFHTKEQMLFADNWIRKHEV